MDAALMALVNRKMMEHSQLLSKLFRAEHGEKVCGDTQRMMPQWRSRVTELEEGIVEHLSDLRECLARNALLPQRLPALT